MVWITLLRSSRARGPEGLDHYKNTVFNLMSSCVYLFTCNDMSCTVCFNAPMHTIPTVIQAWRAAAETGAYIWYLTVPVCIGLQLVHIWAPNTVSSDSIRTHHHSGGEHVAPFQCDRSCMQCDSDSTNFACHSV